MNFLDTIPSRQNLHRVINESVALLKPPPDITLSEWADRYRVLSSEYNAQPGRWYTDAAPYQREIMDVVKRSDVNTVVLKTSTQIGKTELLKNIVGYHIHLEPCPILYVMPTLEMGEAWSKDRLKPMVRDTPVLADKIRIKSRDGDNTILHKTFPGGHITIAGANSPSGLASRPIRVLLLDEVDRYPASAGDEGDPANLAIKRTANFWNRTILMVSSPGITGKSRIDTAYQDTDKRVYEVPCPHCDHYHLLVLANMHAPYEGAPAEEWEYICPSCGAAVEESRHKMQMLRKGKWRATAPFKGKVGFWINEFYSPWKTWKEIVADFLEAKKLPDTLKTFVNTSLAETWDVDREGEGLESDVIHERAEVYEAQVPKPVILLTAAVDVQDDRLECEILGWGMDRETWSIDYRVMWGDPATSDVWEQLDDILLADYVHQSGVTMKIKISVIDSGGHHTEEVYKYVKQKAREKRRIYAIRGHSVRNQPIVAKESRNNSYRVRVFYLGTDTAKEVIYSYLALSEKGPGHMHHPATYDEEYFRQLTSERKVTVYERGKQVTKWILPSKRRNEALDLKVYNFAAYTILKPNMAMVRKRFEERIENHQNKNSDKKGHHKDTSKEDNRPEPPNTRYRLKHKPKRKKGGFVNNY